MKPNALLTTPHSEQSRDGYCLPACVRMILAHWGTNTSEISLVQQLQVDSFGAPISNAFLIEKWGYKVEQKNLTVNELKQHLQNNTPIVAQVWMFMLDYLPEDLDASHVVVVVGYDDKHVYLHDPAIANDFQPILWDGFLAAWAEYDETSIIITPTH